MQCLASEQAVLLVACDVPYPEPLHTVRPLPDSFAVALLLVPPAQAHAQAPLLSVRSGPESAATACQHPGLDALRQGIPAARSLPLLQALALQADTTVVIEGLPGQSLFVQLSKQPDRLTPNPC